MLILYLDYSQTWTTFSIAHLNIEEVIKINSLGLNKNVVAETLRMKIEISQTNNSY